MSPAVPPPSPQEIHRKLSIHSVARPGKTSSTISGTESDSDSIISPDTSAAGISGLTSPPPAPPLSAIVERDASGEDSEEDEDEEGGWKAASESPIPLESADMTVIKAGYLWKKGERRKTWKKRWFVLRPAHLAYYKTAAEYQLLRLLELSDVHSCTPVTLKRHENTFGLVSPIRTFYLQTKTAPEVQDWVAAIERARTDLLANSTQSSVSNPIPIPVASSPSNLAAPPSLTPSPPSHHPSHTQNFTSSDSEEASPITGRSHSLASHMIGTSPSNKTSMPVKDPAKTVLSGYLMKCGSKRRNWRKRWFVLTGERLVYSASHMDTKPHRKFDLTEIVDALEYDITAHRQHHQHPPPTASPIIPSSSEVDDGGAADHTFKIVTTKRTLLLCAPSEEDEIKWLGAIRALIARRSGETGRPMSSSANVDASPPNSAFAPGGRRRRPSVSGGSVGVIPEEGTT